MTPHEEFINENEATIMAIISRWIPQGNQNFYKKLIESKKWFENFKPSQCSLALMLLEKIQYVSDPDIRGYIETSAKQIEKIFNYDLTNVLFYPLGDSSASSGSQFLYQYGKELGLKDENFKYDDFRLHLNSDVNIVFFDDIIGSGNQATKFFNKNLINSKAKCHYIALLGFEHGFNKVKKDAGFQSLVVCKRLTDEEMAFSDNSYVFKNPDERYKIKSLCQEYGKNLYPDHPLGYDDSQALIVLPYNTPNNTLPVIWAGPESESSAEETWHPVWTRKKKLKLRHPLDAPSTKRPPLGATQFTSTPRVSPQTAPALANIVSESTASNGIKRYIDFYDVHWEWKVNSDGIPAKIRCLCPQCKTKMIVITKGYGTSTNLQCQNCKYTPKSIPYPSELLVEKLKEKILSAD